MAGYQCMIGSPGRGWDEIMEVGRCGADWDVGGESSEWRDWVSRKGGHWRSLDTTRLHAEYWDYINVSIGYKKTVFLCAR